MGLIDAVDAGACAALWRSDDPKLYTAALASLEAQQATKKTKYGDLNKLHAKWVALEKTLRKNGELSKKELQTVMSFKLTRGKMRPLMRFVDAADDGAVRSASRAALSALAASSSSADCGAAFGSMSLPGVGVATVSVIFAAADPRFAIMSDAALEACCGAPAHKKTYGLDEYRALLEALEAKAAALGGDWSPRSVEIALYAASLVAGPKKRKREDQ